MTRARLFRRRPMSLQAYIHRATVGLPKAERLDAAAELRTHLVERIDILRAEGHPADEAEFLAVQAMGDPAPTNRGLLGHAFTHRLGWLALGLVIIGGGGWYGYGYAEREWMPPREGVEYTGDSLTLDDLKTVNADSNAPRGTYQSATLTYPKGTKTIYYAMVTPNKVKVGQKDLAKEMAENLILNSVHRFPGSYRYQERWLLTEIKSDTVCTGRWEQYVNLEVIPSDLMNLHSTSMTGALSDLQNCSGVKRQYEQRIMPLAHGETKSYQYTVELLPQTPGSLSSQQLPFTINHWTILRDVVLNPRTARNGSPASKGETTGMYIAVLPTNWPPNKNQDYWEGQVDAKGIASVYTYDEKVLLELPQLNAKQGHFVAP